MSVLMKVENVCKNFSGLKALSNINLDIMDDEIFGIIGPNGAGKTTLFNVITGFNAPSEGKVIYNGKDMTGKNITYFCKEGIARTFQNIRVFDALTVLDNLLVGMHKNIHTNLFDILFHTPKYKKEENTAKEKAMGILKYLGIADIAYEQAGSLPYGKQRKVEIGRALASDPKLLLLDEPTAGMNPQETMELAELIKGIRKLCPSVIVIEHNMQFMMSLSERIAVLNFGMLLACSSPGEIQKNEQVVEAYLGSEEDDTNAS